jgi:hypothetical protein
MRRYNWTANIYEKYDDKGVNIPEEQNFLHPIDTIESSFELDSDDENLVSSEIIPLLMNWFAEKMGWEMRKLDKIFDFFDAFGSCYYTRIDVEEDSDECYKCGCYHDRNSYFWYVGRGEHRFRLDA